MLRALRLVWHYWERVFRLAAKATCHTLWLDSPGRVMVIVLVAAIYGLLVWKFVGKDAAQSEMVSQMLAWLSPLFAFPAVFLWNLVFVPAKVQMESQGKITELSKTLQERTMSRGTALALSEFWRRGMEMLGRDVHPRDEADWVRETQRWERITMEYLANYYTWQEANYFQTVRFRVPHNPIHTQGYNKAAAGLDARLGHLRSVLDANRTDWSTITAEERKRLDRHLAAFEAETFASDGLKALD
ncbi:MAG TPA: hypothetical protein VFE34_04540 [Dongiaceae bacterium]|jgi:hypothetical protein|nr:hypothetical protein [Dongiaceae bacterium]